MEKWAVEAEYSMPMRSEWDNSDGRERVKETNAETTVERQKRISSDGGEDDMEKARKRTIIYNAVYSWLVSGQINFKVFGPLQPAVTSDWDQHIAYQYMYYNSTAAAAAANICHRNLIGASHSMLYFMCVCTLNACGC